MIFLLIQAIENDSDKNRILTLYTKHYSLMKLKALRILHESQIADDMVQDALVSVIKKIDALRDLSDAQLLSYTVKAVQSQSIDYYRKHIRKGTNVPLEDLEDLYSSDDELIDEVIDAIYKKDLSIKLGIILRKLPERDRMIILYKYFLQYSDEKIAKLLNIKTESVRMALTRARNKVKKSLQFLVTEEES